MVGNCSLKIETDCTHDEFIRGKPFVDKVCVVYNVTAEDEATSDSIDEIHSAIKWKKYANKASYT